MGVWGRETGIVIRGNPRWWDVIGLQECCDCVHYAQYCNPHREYGLGDTEKDPLESFVSPQ